MHATLRTLLVAPVFVLVTAACGRVEIDEELPVDTTVRPTIRRPTVATPAAPTSAAPTTTAAPELTGGRTCLAIFNDGQEMTRQYVQEQQGTAGADEAKYRARAQVLADEARSEGCQVPPVVEAFLR